MSKSMLVNVTAEEEHRVAIVDNGVLDIFEIETLSREHLKGNIFKAIVEGINPALEAAFVNYGGERAGFLPLDEINFKLYPSRDAGAPVKGRGGRISKHLDKGQEVLVQVIRDSYASKPPTLSTYYSLPGRYLVLMPGADAGGISRKIEDTEQRDRLRGILDQLTVPEGFGVIVRTAGMETSSRELQADLEALLELWRNIERAGEQVKPPALIFQERDLVIRTIRDYFTSDIEEVLIDDEATYRRARKFFEAHMPDKAEVVRLYTGDKPIFSKHNLEDQIERIYKRVVDLKSGGSIAIDQTEALTAVDVNSARSARSAGSEETATRTNLEAADEIARQLRLRDIGGLVVIDFIDMEATKHIRQVERAFAEAMSRDKARYDVTRISKLGLMEVSRQRIKSTKASSSFMECPTCAGDGTIRTPEAAARSAFRKIQARVVRGDTAGVKVYLPPEVALHLLNEKRDDLYRLESRQKVRIEVVPEGRMKPHQFEIEEVRREEQEITPMVTAETVDLALASGTLPIVPPRSSEPREPSPVSARPVPAGAEAANGGRKRRRRRRHRGGQRGQPGLPHEAAERSAPETGGAAAGATGGETGAEGAEAPVFSEGPEQDEPSPVQTHPAHQEAPPGPGAQGPGRGEAEAGQAPHRRRRRRRRGRGRHREQGPAQSAQRSEGSPMSDASGSSGSSDDRGAAGNGSTGQRGGAALDPAPTWSRPVAAASTHDHFDDRSGASEPGAGSEAPAVEGETAGASPGGKPRRRWWRRPQRG
ncbi:MAG TPA: Rne/Rng family ribonuclease [Candidatus Polarisedimenticolia bacterium]